MDRKQKNILWFKEINKNDGGLVGGKGANLGEMTSLLGDLVPNGFVVTASAYFEFIKNNQLAEKIAKILKSSNAHRPEELIGASKTIKQLILAANVPAGIAKDIISSYHRLGGVFGLKQALVAVRSSATAEDLPGASFAGQQETFLNIRGEANLVNSIRQAWASLFTPRAIFYREEKGFDHNRVGLAAVVQRMVQSEVSGVMFTVDPVTNQKNRTIIEAVWGLGEYIVQGTVTPDHYQVDKTDHRIIKIQTASQRFQLTKQGTKTMKSSVPPKQQGLQKLNSAQIVELAKIGDQIHQHYFFPQDIEWGIENKQFYILQSRPVTTLKTKTSDKETGIEGELVLVGDGASPGIGQGKVVILKKVDQIGKIKKGDVLVATMTSPDFVPAMKKAAAIITDKGGQTSHAAIVSRELGTPCVVGTKRATQILKNGDQVIVDGQNGKVWLGQMKKGSFVKKKVKVTGNRKITTATKLYVNLAEPELAETIAERDIDGVGLLRAEFIIAQIGVHPQKMIQEGRQAQFSQKLADGMLKFCQAFNPKPVVYRATDFKTNEYQHLEGGDLFEPKEPNPMLGFRGAIRYISLPEVFQLELDAIKTVRNKHGFKNLWLMVPFVRTPKELLEVKRMASAAGLTRGSNFKLWMMVEIPSNVWCLKQFIDVGIDGVSIGSNDLTMLILGLDRDNSEVAQGFNENDPAVLKAIRKTIKTCNKYGLTSSICGQAPSEHPQLIEKLVRWGITSVSVSPDAIDGARETIAWAEKRKIAKTQK